VGTAVRAGYDIPRPGMGSFFGRVAKQTGGNFVKAAPKDLFGVPVHAMQWDVEYTLDGPPQNIQSPPALDEQ